MAIIEDTCYETVITSAQTNADSIIYPSDYYGATITSVCDADKLRDAACQFSFLVNTDSACYLIIESDVAVLNSFNIILAQNNYINEIISDSIQANSLLSLSSIIGAYLNSAIYTGNTALTSIGSGYSDIDAHEIWVFNINNNAFSRYHNFIFNSFGKFNGHYIGAKPDGIYLLNGADDSGVEIQSMLDFGSIDFGVLNLKSISNVYVGVSSTNNLYLKVIADGAEYVYKSRAFDTNTKVQRFDLGKGLRANFCSFELYGNGYDFELTDIEFMEIPIKRRI